ncbi:MAG: hypothetical protein ACHRHE_17965 [Tepidisphaerales bacterium]
MPRIKTYTWASLTALGLNIVNPAVTMCMCGHMDFSSLPGNLAAFTLASIAFIRGRGRIIPRTLACVALILSGIILAQNTHNILWSGHNPLLRTR